MGATCSHKSGHRIANNLKSRTGQPSSPIDAKRQIVHIDMDCFYAAIEVRDRPELRQEPVAVGGRSQRRGVLTTCNYKAREFGCRSAMPTFQAIQRCPHLIVLPVRFDAYRHESRKIRHIFQDYTELIEPLSLDEAYLDLSHHRRPAAAIASEIRRRIRLETGLNASAGIAPNKMLAKIASDWQKPNGQFEIRPHQIEGFMQDLSVSKIWGVGKRAAARLGEFDIATCGQLQKIERWQLQSWFGKFGGELFELSRGIDPRPVVAHRIRKSMSCERTFMENITAPDEGRHTISSIYDELTADLAKLKSDRPITKLFVKAKYADFSRASIERSSEQYSLRAYHDLFDELYRRRPDPIRLLGVGVRFAEPDTVRGGTQQLEFQWSEPSSPIHRTKS